MDNREKRTPRSRPTGGDEKTLRWLDDIEDSAPGQVPLLAVPVLLDEGYTPDEASAIIRYWNDPAR